MKDFREGDVVIGSDPHSATVKIVEASDEDGLLLVDGIKDEFFYPEEFGIAREKYRMLCKKEDRQDVELNPQKQYLKELFNYLLNDSRDVMEISRTLEESYFSSKGKMAQTRTGNVDIHIKVFDKELHNKEIKRAIKYLSE